MEDNQDDMVTPVGDDDLYEAEPSPDESKSKKMKNYIFIGALLAVFLIGGLLAFSSMSGGDDEFAVQGGPPPLPAKVGEQPVTPAVPAVSERPANAGAASDGADIKDPFNGAAPEVEASTFDVLDEVATEDPFSVELQSQPSDVEVVDEPFPGEQLQTSDNPNLPRPDIAVVQERVRAALPDSYEGMGPEGFCLGEDEIASLIDEKLEARITPMVSAVAELESRLDAFESSFTERMDSLEALLLDAVNNAGNNKDKAANATTGGSSSESDVTNKYFRVVGAMRGVAWLAVKGGDPVKLSEGDILKGFGVIEKISADGGIWSDKGRVPTKAFR